MNNFEINSIHEIDGEWLGNVIGFYFNGHVDKKEFFKYAKAEYQEHVDDYEEDDYEEDIILPFDISKVVHCYYRFPTEKELENDMYTSELEFIFSKNGEKGYLPITKVEW